MGKTESGYTVKDQYQTMPYKDSIWNVGPIYKVFVKIMKGRKNGTGGRNND